MAIKEIKYGDVEQRAQTIKTYVDEAAEAAKTQANAYTDEQIKNIPAPPAPDIPTALPQKYSKRNIVFWQEAWSEYYRPIWKGSQTLSADRNLWLEGTEANLENCIYPLIFTIISTSGSESTITLNKTDRSKYGHQWSAKSASGDETIAATWDRNYDQLIVSISSSSGLGGATLTQIALGRKQYIYRETDDTVGMFMSADIKENSKVILTLDEETKPTKYQQYMHNFSVIEANGWGINDEMVFEPNVGEGLNRVCPIADRLPAWDEDNWRLYITGTLEVEQTDTVGAKECRYDKIDTLPFNIRIGDFDFDKEDVVQYYIKGALKLDMATPKQVGIVYKPVSGEEKTLSVRTVPTQGYMADVSQLFDQEANTIFMVMVSGGGFNDSSAWNSKITDIGFSSAIRTLCDPNDEIIITAINDITPKRTTEDTTLTAAGWANNQQEVSVGDLSPTDDVSPIFATDSAEQAYKDAEITGKIGTNKVVFTCQSVPTADIPVTLVITRW